MGGRGEQDAVPSAWRLRRNAACRAPFSSMYFDQFGGVRACCANTGALLGDIRTQTLRDIWGGDATRSLRSSLAHGDLSNGCGLCSWQADQGGRSSMMARSFDHLPVGRRQNRLGPELMQFSLSNACNLQCVMCNGDLSSAIRAHREHLPPLPRPYGERFFGELAEFVPHLREARFLGGEPLLGRESLQVLDLLVELNPSVGVSVTTNGTVWSDRLEEVSRVLPMTFHVSLDAATPTTFEAIRVGASWDTVMSNLDHFGLIARRSGTSVGISHCLMVDNWHEFGDLLELAERRGLGCYVNTVVFPHERSLYQLPHTELRRVVSGLEQRELTLRLPRLGDVWDAQITMLRSRLRELERGVPSDVEVDPWRGGQHTLQTGSAASLGPTPVALSSRSALRSGTAAAADEGVGDDAPQR